MNPLPCPFCGKIPDCISSNPVGFLDKLVFKKSYFVACRNELCRVNPSTEHYLEQKSSIEAWNMRPNQGLPM